MIDPSDLSVEIPLPDLDPIAEPIGDPKGICSRIIDAEAKSHMFDIPKELVHGVELVSSSGLDNVTKDNDPTDDEETLTASNPKHDRSESDALAQDNVLKKPDKILPCPRCKSSSTKFCYYNNHNVNQPRHFCKNCQRYWTAGGTMRNVPVGAGRRKTKHSLQRQADSEAFSVSMRPLMGNVAIMEHGPDLPSCNSITSDLSLGGQKNAKMVVSSGGENAKEPSLSFPVTSNCPAVDFSKFEAHQEQAGSPGCCGGLPAMHPLQGFPGPPWPLRQGCNDACAMTPIKSSDNGFPDLFPWVAPLILPPPLYVPAVPFPVMPAPFWACISGWPNEALTAPWRGSVNGLSPSLLAKINEGSSGNDSSTLGKHSRDGSLQREEERERKTLWVPKTLRIDDPEEAAKSSIWSTLGIKPNESIKRGSLFRGFQSNNENSGYTSNAAQVLHANPSALFRSQTFQERA